MEASSFGVGHKLSHAPVAKPKTAMTEGGSDIIGYGLAGGRDGIIIVMALQFGAASQERVNR